MATTPPRICDLGTTSKAVWRAVARRAGALGFSHMLMQDSDAVSRCAVEAATEKLSLLTDLDLFEFEIGHPWVAAHPDLFAVRRSGCQGKTVDPRGTNPSIGRAYARFYANPSAFMGWWSETINGLLESGIAGFRMRQPDRLGSADWLRLIKDARRKKPGAIFIADTIGLNRDAMAKLTGAGFDYCLSSLPWWDLRAPWLAEEYEATLRMAPVLACAGIEGHAPPALPQERCTRLVLAALTGSGIIVPLSFVEEDGAETAIRAANNLVASDPVIAAPGALRSLTGPGAPVTVLLRADRADLTRAGQALVALINPDRNASVPLAAAEQLRGWDIAPAGLLSGRADDHLAPGEARLMLASRCKPVRAPSRQGVRDATSAAKQPRIVIANICPAIDGGACAVKRTVGDVVMVEADIFTDGHPLIAAEVLLRAEDEKNWQRVAMAPLANDRWSAQILLDRIGRYRFAIEAWLDEYGGFTRDLSKRLDAGQEIRVDLQDGLKHIEKVAARATCALKAPLAAMLAEFGALKPDRKAAALLAPETVQAMRNADARAFRVQSDTFAMDADREGARFANWYELFPRSQTDDAARHGTFADVVARLPAIQAMGFDVLYLPPIQPIGAKNRKGRNNAVHAAPDDPGSVYAIGSKDGGHDAIHPELGTLADFRALIAAAQDRGMEIALDFAVQCSPDHPWLTQHPGWFDWRADGSIKYAENPPKRYEDIVNVDFYAPDALPALWLALRDIVLFWAETGVRIFRVDNPHTKPFAFWQWLIRDVRAAQPDVLFLAEAFTRPKIMYHLAKLGFTQSYTYFTWRNTKDELTAYMRELIVPPVSDFYRPHFFVNTPDINPVFLQTSGRAGFLIRAALAATLSGLWGIYSGFELCEAAALPGREEYLDSEKYAVKPRDWNAPGNIITEIAQLNRLRRAEPALQTQMGLTFYNAFNPNILYYGKYAPGETTRILVAVSLNPHGAEEADFEIPLWEWGLPDSGALAVEDVLSGARFNWHGKIQHMRLAPDAPYRIWRVSPAMEA